MEEVDGKQVKDQANVFSKEEKVSDANAAGTVIWVMVSDVLEDFDLNETLVVEFGLASNDLQSTMNILLVIINPYHPPKRSLPQTIYHLVPISNVIILLPKII